MLPSRYFSDLTQPEIAAQFKKNPLVLLPCGSVEQHGPHLPTGTDFFHAAILLWAAGLAHVSAGNVDFGLVGNILIGSIPGVWVGSHWSVRVNPAVLRTTLAIVLIGAGLALLIKAGLDLPLEILIPFPVAVIVLLIVTIARSRRASKQRDIQIPSGM